MLLLHCRSSKLRQLRGGGGGGGVSDDDVSRLILILLLREVFVVAEVPVPLWLPLVLPVLVPEKEDRFIVTGLGVAAATSTSLRFISVRDYS